jgi:cold shock CspA family protein
MSEHSGILKVWDATKGYGFIEMDSGDGPDIFAHAKFFVPGFRPAVGQRVSFSFAKDERSDRDRADKIKLISSLVSSP